MKIKAFRGFCGCGTRIRTQTNRVRVCRATITQSRNVHMLLYLIFGRCQALFRFNLFFLKIHLKRSPQSSIISFAIPLLFAGVSEWQTRRTQNPLAATSCGFKSHRRHQTNIIRTYFQSVMGSDYLFSLTVTKPPTSATG